MSDHDGEVVGMGHLLAEIERLDPHRYRSDVDYWAWSAALDAYYAAWRAR